jgi:hypothetical protein
MFGRSKDSLQPINQECAEIFLNIIKIIALPSLLSKYFHCHCFKFPIALSHGRMLKVQNILLDELEDRNDYTPLRNLF